MMELITNRTTLKELSLSDLQDIHQLHLFPETDQYNILGIPEHIQTTEKILNQWLEQQNGVPRTSYIFCIRQFENDEFVGLMALILGKLNYKIADVWYKIHPNHWRMNYAKEALTRLLQFGFKELGLHRIEAGCAVDNTATIKVLEKAGMVREGRKRKLLPKGGEWMDNYFYAILDTDFEKSLAISTE